MSDDLDCLLSRRQSMFISCFLLVSAGIANFILFLITV